MPAKKRRPKPATAPRRAAATSMAQQVLDLERRLAEAEELVAGQRADFDALAQVLALRDQLSDERNTTNMKNAGRLQTALRAADRLGWYERAVPSLAAARRHYEKELQKRAKQRPKGAPWRGVDGEGPPT